MSASGQVAGLSETLPVIFGLQVSQEFSNISPLANRNTDSAPGPAGQLDPGPQSRQ